MIAESEGGEPAARGVAFGRVSRVTRVTTAVFSLFGRIARTTLSGRLAGAAIGAGIFGAALMPSAPALAVCFPIGGGLYNCSGNTSTTLGPAAANGLIINTTTGTSNINNQLTITPGGNNLLGLGVTVAANTGTVNFTNNAPITATNAGISVGATNVFNLTNNAVITGTASTSSGVFLTPLVTGSAGIINNSTIQGGAFGMTGGVNGDLTITNNATGIIQSTTASGTGIFLGAGGTINGTNTGQINGGTGGGVTLISALNGDNNFDNTDGTIQSTGGTGLFLINLGNGAIDIGGNAASSVTSDNGPGTGGPGILGVGLGSGKVTIDAGVVDAGPNAPLTTGYAPIDDIGGLLSGGVMGVSLNGGDVNVNLHGNVTVDDGALWGALAFSDGGSATVSGDAGISVGGASPIVGMGSVTFGSGDATVNAENLSVTGHNIGLLGFNFGTGNAVIKAEGSTVTTEDPFSVGILGIASNTIPGPSGNVSIDSGLVNSQGSGIIGVATGGTVDINLHDTVNSDGWFGVAGFGAGDVGIDLHGNTVTNTDGLGVLGVAFGGNVNIEASGSSVTANDVGISGTAFDGNVSIDSGTVQTGAVSGLLSGGVLGFAADGNVDITTHGEITTAGNFGAMGVSIGGDATVTVGAAIDPPAWVGAGTFTFGPGTAHTIINAPVQSLGVGLLGGNVGGGDVIVDANSSVAADFIGILATNVGDGETDVNVAGAIGGYSAAATGDDGINVFTGFGTGDVNVNTYTGAAINAGDDGIDVYKILGAGAVNIATGDDVAAADEGIAVFRTATTGDTVVSVGLNGASHVSSQNADGVQVFSPLTSGNVIVDVAEGSSVSAPNQSAIKVATFDLPLAADNDVKVTNAGDLTGAGGDLTTATIVVGADGFVSVHNDHTGFISAVTAAPDAPIMSVLAGQDVDVTNSGKMIGAVALVSAEGNVWLNNVYGSGGIWHTSGLNVLAATGDTVLDNLEDPSGNNPSITTYDTTTFSFIDGGSSAVNNSGDIHVNGVANFGDSNGPLDDFNNRHGLLTMINGVSDYGTAVTPYYKSGVGDQTNITGNFNGGEKSVLGVDAALARPGDSSADLLVVGGKVTKSTDLVVNNTAAIPGTSNETGIPVVEVLSGKTDNGDFALSGGPIDTGLFNYDLYLDKTPGYTPAGYPDTATWLLASTPNTRAFELPAISSGLEMLWNTSAITWHDRTADLRRIAPGSPTMSEPNGVLGRRLRQRLQSRQDRQGDGVRRHDELQGELQPEPLRHDRRRRPHGLFEGQRRGGAGPARRLYRLGHRLQGEQLPHQPQRRHGRHIRHLSERWAVHRRRVQG